MSAALDSFAPSIAHLRTIATPVTDYRVLPFGIDEIDNRLGAGGLRAGALHEATAQSGALVDDAATTLFLAGIAAREAANAGGLVLWASCRPDIYAPGLAQAGLTAATVIYAHTPDDATLLSVIEDAARDGTPSAIVADVSKVSMVATRRLQLVAAEADMPILLMRRRRKRDEDPFAEPSAAWTRWRIGSAPSARLDVAGVGRARWSIELARQRGGEGFSLILEASDETGCLAVPAELGHRTAETVGTARFAAA
jgi:protein ImuA